MVKLARSMTLLTVVGFLAACQTEPAEQTGATEEAATADAASARTEIESINDRFEQALLAQDASAIAAMYTEDAVILPPSDQRTEGRTAIESLFTSWFGQVPASELFTLTTDDLVLAESGDIAYEIGTYKTAGTSPAGDTYEETGKYLAVWENIGGEWKMAADMWSGDAPMREPGETAPEGTSSESKADQQDAAEPAVGAEAGS